MKVKCTRVQRCQFLKLQCELKRNEPRNIWSCNIFSVIILHKHHHPQYLQHAQYPQHSQYPHNLHHPQYLHDQAGSALELSDGEAMAEALVKIEPEVFTPSWFAGTYLKILYGHGDFQQIIKSYVKLG